MIIIKPNPNEVPDFYKGYIDACIETDLIDALNNGLAEAAEFFKTIPPEKENYSYSEGKWTVKEVLIHIIDAERVFGYRALRFSRMDDTPLAMFKENFYIPNSNAAARNVASIQSEFEGLRIANIELFKGMNQRMLDFTGIANNNKMSAKAIGWMIAGHTKHHLKILKERYL